MHVQLLGPTFGAIVSDLDLAGPLSANQLLGLHFLLMRHQVLVFERQRVAPQQQCMLAARLGALQRVPLHPMHTRGNGHAAPFASGLCWQFEPTAGSLQADVAFVGALPIATLLAIRRVGPTVRESLWGNGTSVYDSLSPDMRRMLDALTAEHDVARVSGTLRGAQVPHTPVAHPLVCMHPVTRRRGLYAHEAYTTRIREVTPKQGTTLLCMLQQYLALPEHSVRWQWKAGDMALWDNRCVSHLAGSRRRPMPGRT